MIPIVLALQLSCNKADIIYLNNISIIFPQLISLCLLNKEIGITVRNNKVVEPK